MPPLEPIGASETQVSCLLVLVVIHTNFKSVFKLAIVNTVNIMTPVLHVGNKYAMHFIAPGEQSYYMKTNV